MLTYRSKTCLYFKATDRRKCAPSRRYISIFYDGSDWRWV